MALLGLVLLVLSTVAATPAAPATYEVRVPALSPLRLAVRATLPVHGTTLKMADSRPGNVPEINDGGWQALVKDLACVDATGRSVSLTAVAPGGWTLPPGTASPVTLTYAVDYSLLAGRNWPAAREAAFADASAVVVVGRSLFVVSPDQGPSVVRVSPPDGFRARLPWEWSGGREDSWSVPSTTDLVENLVVLTREAPDDVAVGGFRFHVIALGGWRAARSAVHRVLRSAIGPLAEMIGSRERATYNLVLLPLIEHGGESFRSSFALTWDAAPTDANLGAWGGTIVHEIFHYWNGWRLDGADYASSNWFREGITEYVASLALAKGGLIDESAYRAKLAAHVDTYGRLATPLDAPGTHKGPPLYSGGALVAFCWDTRIREATGGRRNLGDFLRALWRRCEAGNRPYAWTDIEAALQDTLSGDWGEFNRRFIHGTEPLPLEEAFARVGLRLRKGPDGTSIVELDTAAPRDARERWKLMVRPA